MVFYYIEKDGRVYLVEKNGKMVFPTSKNLPFEIREIRKMPFADIEVIYCEPLVPFPTEWINKEKVMTMENVDTVVRRTIYQSRAMMAAEGIILNNGKILAVKPNRGWGKDTWKLPAGVVSYGETPEQSMRREALEEVGLTITTLELIALSKRVFPESESWFICFTFLCETKGEIKLAVDEIAEYAWMDPLELMKKTRNPFVKYGIKKMLEGPTLEIADLDSTH